MVAETRKEYIRLFVVYENHSVSSVSYTHLSKAVVMLAVVMASVMNFSASASNPTQYVKNEEMTGELMTAKTCLLYTSRCV